MKDHCCALGSAEHEGLCLKYRNISTGGISLYKSWGLKRILIGAYDNGVDRVVKKPRAYISGNQDIHQHIRNRFMKDHKVWMVFARSWFGSCNISDWSEMKL